VSFLSGNTLEVLREDSEFTLFRGHRLSDSLPVLALTPRYGYESMTTLRRMENEFAIAGELDSAWAARPLELLRRSENATLILEDPGGYLLDSRLGTAFETTVFLRIAVSLAEALRKIHFRGLIHKDIKPANLFVDEANVVRVTGFGIASRLSRERQALAPAEFVGGTFAYMAPEQTGRMNRSVDARSDLYSMGVTLYQMLTGSLPFMAADPMGWIHCHIARQPERPEERVKGIPKTVADIVLKLLAKNAEDRYQSAAGVLADLKRCQASWESRQGIDLFSLGESDGLDRLLIPEKLYGRETDINALLEAFGRVVHGGSMELVLVSGYSGVGKSSVVNELHKTIVSRRGLFAWGKFDQYKRDIPYATLAQSLQGLVGQILGQNDEVLTGWRNRLQDALGQNAQLVINLVPQIELVIGRQPELQDLSPQDAQTRFQAVIRRFIDVFAQPKHPLVLFLDDLQWIDPATLDLLKHLTTHAEVRNLLLVGAYRDNEVGSTHPLTRTLAEISKAKAAVCHISLANLILGDVTRLVADALRCRPDHARSLAQLVHAKTGGNPFFVIQFISSLEQEGLLAFATGKAIWSWNVEEIVAKGFTENVVDLMVTKLRRLPINVQNALKQLACMGNSARIATLTAVYGETREVLYTALWEAVRLEFVSCHDDTYSFIHDRIQEAAYLLIPESERVPIHLRIGRVLAQSLTAEDADEQIFDVVSHLDVALNLIESPSERQKVAGYNLIAGRRAKASTAYAAALKYFKAGSASLLSVETWDYCYRLHFDLELNRAECEFLTGDLETASIRLSKLAGRAENVMDRAATTRLRMTLYTTLDRTDLAVAVGLEFLRHVGVEWSPHPADGEVSRELARTWELLGAREIEELIDLPIMEDPELLAAVDVLAEFLAPASFTDNNLFYLAVLRITNLSMEHGNCDASACAYALLNVVLGRSCDYQAVLRFGQLGCDLVDELGLDRFKARVYTFFGTFVLPWTAHFPRSRAILKRAIDAATAVGDLTYIAYSLRSVVANMMVSGDPLSDVQLEADKALTFMREAKFGLAADSLVAQLILVDTLRGQTLSRGLILESDKDELGFEQRLNKGGSRLTVAAARYQIYKLQGYFFTGNIMAAVVAATKARDLVWSTLQFLEIVDYHYYSALALAAAARSAPAEGLQSNLDEIDTHRRQIERWAKGCAVNHVHREALIAAEIASLAGRDSDAMRLYEEAIQSARENGFIQNEGVASELAAIFYQARGAWTAARSHRRHAYACYERWGAVAKVRQLEALDPSLIEGHQIGAAGPGPKLEHLDLAAMIKTSQAVSEEIVLERLIERLMVIAVEHAGADRGLLILSDENDVRIEAEARIEGGSVHVDLRRSRVSSTEICEPILRYVLRTQESIVLDDASAVGPFAEDDYIRWNRIRSLKCLPLVKQSRLVGTLYLENRLATHVFTPERIALLRTLASQAAISLENARLYSDLKSAEARLQASHDEMQMLVSLIENSSDFIGYIPTSSRDCYINAGGRRMVGIELDADISEVQISDLRPAGEDQRYSEEILPTLIRDGRWIGERNLRHFKTNASIPVLQNLFYIVDKYTGERKGIATICKEITEQRQAAEALRRAQADLEKVAQRTTMGEFAASIAHELNQPLMSIVTSAETCLIRLDRDPPEIEKARVAAERVVRDGHRASDVIKTVRVLLKKTAPDIGEFEANQAIRDVLDLARPKIDKEGISLDLNLVGSAPVIGDRGQFQQVVLNLVANGMEAMLEVKDRIRLLYIGTRQTEEGFVTISVADSGVGVDPVKLDQIYDAFFSTKPEGMGMGLAICRSIVEMHGGRLWATPRVPHGITFSFTVPTAAALNQ
jgi:predicted ATPase/signal transduction histidine kinase